MSATKRDSRLPFPTALEFSYSPNTLKQYNEEFSIEISSLGLFHIFYFRDRCELFKKISFLTQMVRI